MGVTLSRSSRERRERNQGASSHIVTCQTVPLRFSRSAGVRAQGQIANVLAETLRLWRCPNGCLNHWGACSCHRVWHTHRWRCDSLSQRPSIDLSSRIFRAAIGPGRGGYWRRTRFPVDGVSRHYRDTASTECTSPWFGGRHSRCHNIEAGLEQLGGVSYTSKRHVLKLPSGVNVE